MAKSLVERKVKAIEDYLGIVIELDEDEKNPYDEYHEKEYGLGAEIKKLKEKVFPKKKSRWS